MTYIADVVDGPFAKAWNNFYSHAIEEQREHEFWDIFEKEHGGRNIFGGPDVEFSTEEEAMLFKLRFS